MATFSVKSVVLFLSDNLLSDLDCVEGGTFANLVAYTPESDTILICQITADTAYIYIVCATEVERHGVREGAVGS